MCPKDITDICIPWRDYEKRLMVPLIIELEFEKDILDTHIIIGGENIQLRMKNERPTLCERCLQFGHIKKDCRRTGTLYKLCRTFAEGKNARL